MQIIESKDNDFLGKIINLIELNEHEQIILTYYMACFNRILPIGMIACGKNEELDDNYKKYLNAMNYNIKQFFDITSRELEIYKKMLHFIKLLLFNDLYENFEETEYYAFFEEVVATLEENYVSRSIMRQVYVDSLGFAMVNKTKDKEIKIVDADVKSYMALNDGFYDDILDNIPRR